LGSPATLTQPGWQQALLMAQVLGAGQRLQLLSQQQIQQWWQQSQQCCRGVSWRTIYILLCVV